MVARARSAAAGAPGLARGRVVATPAQVQSALTSSGTTNWNDVDDPDNTKERLLNVAAY